MEKTRAKLCLQTIETEDTVDGYAEIYGNSHELAILIEHAYEKSPVFRIAMRSALKFLFKKETEEKVEEHISRFGGFN